MTLTANDTKALQQLPLFAPVPRAALKRLFDSARLHSFASDSILFRENESAEYLYVALDGHVALMASGAGEGDVIVEFVPPGHPFITAAVLLNRPFLMTARVIETTRVALLPAGDFRKAVAAEHSLSLSLNMVASEHWRLLIGQVKSLKMRTASQRLAAFLISLVDRYAGTATVTLPCERQVLASWLGMVPRVPREPFATWRRWGSTAEAAPSRSSRSNGSASLPMFGRPASSSAAGAGHKRRLRGRSPRHGVRPSNAVDAAE